MVEEGGFISRSIDLVCNLFERKLPGRSNFIFYSFILIRVMYSINIVAAIFSGTPRNFLG